MRDPLCPICGAYSPRHCEMREELSGICPWEESEDDVPDPDRLREDRDERLRIEKELPPSANEDRPLTLPSPPKDPAK